MVVELSWSKHLRSTLVLLRVAGLVDTALPVVLDGAVSLCKGADSDRHTGQALVPVVLADDLLLDLEVIRPTR